MLLLTASPLHFSSASSSSSFLIRFSPNGLSVCGFFFLQIFFFTNPKVQLTQLFLFFRLICVPNYITTTTRRKETTRRFDHVVRLLCRLISFIQASSLSSVFVI